MIVGARGSLLMGGLFRSCWNPDARERPVGRDTRNPFLYGINIGESPACPGVSDVTSDLP